jgi:hypothetical protein
VERVRKMVSPRTMTTRANPPIRSSVSGDDAEARAIVAAVPRVCCPVGVDRLFWPVLPSVVVRCFVFLRSARRGGAGSVGVTTGVRTIAGGGVTGTDGCGAGVAGGG